MKPCSWLLLFCFLIVYSCADKPKSNTVKISDKTADSISNKKLFIHGDPENFEDSLPNKRFKKSEIISCSFKKEALFGVWTTSHDNPACDFELSAKKFLLCDYDGDGSRLYKIEKDTLYLDNPFVLFKGLILKATGDTLVIHWQENENPETLLRWKDNPVADDEKQESGQVK